MLMLVCGRVSIEKTSDMHMHIQILVFLITQNEKKQSSDSNDAQMGVSKNNGTPKWMVYKGKLY